MKIPRFLSYSPLFVAIFLLSPTSSIAESTGGGDMRKQPTFGFDIVSLRRSGIIVLATSGDLNGDKAPDLLLFHKPSKESFDKTCSVHLQRRGKFQSEPQAEITIGKNISWVGIVDIDSHGKDDLCRFDADGMVVFQLANGAPDSTNRSLRCQTLLPHASRRLVEVDWTADLNADNRTDVMLPMADGFRLFTKNENLSFSESRKFEFPLTASFGEQGGQNHLNYRLPKLEFSDFDKDKRTDIGMFDLEKMDFFLTNGSDVPMRHVSAPLIREFTKDFISATDFKDLNADGIPDAVLALISQKKDLESEVRVYFGSKDFSYGDRPAHTYGGKARFILPIFFDANGDGKMEMLLHDISVGFGFFINYFLANRIAVETEIRTLGPNGRYDEPPALKRTIYVSVSDTGGEPARGTGDFNGDGREDLVVGTSENQLSFFLAEQENILPKERNSYLGVPAYGEMSTMDLNSDGRSDIVITYAQKDKENLATLLLSR